MARKWNLLENFVLALTTMCFCLAVVKSEGGGELPQGEVVFEGEAGKITVWKTSAFGPLEDLLLNAAEVVIEPQGLRLPMYASVSHLIYILEGSGRVGLSYPFGFPSNARRVKKGDIFAIPAGWTFWILNDQPGKLHYFSAVDTSTSPPGSYQGFELMGAPGDKFESILNGFSTGFLAAAWDVPDATVDQLLKAQNGRKIVKVKAGDMPSANSLPHTFASELGGPEGTDENGMVNFVYNLEETQLDINVDNGGYINAVTSDKLKVLKQIGLGATLFHLEKGVIVPPCWYSNAGSVAYAMRGGGKVQIATADGKAFYSKDVKAGDVFVYPYQAPAIAIAGPEGFDWIELQTSSSVEATFLIGMNGIYRSLPPEVLQAGFNIDEKLVEELYEHRQNEAVIFPPKGPTFGYTQHRLRKMG